MLSVYLDESSHEDPDSYITLAGFFGDKEQWDAFVPDWKNALGQRPSLHMKDIRGWHRNKARIERSLKKLREVSHSHSLFPIFASLRANAIWTS